MPEPIFDLTDRVTPPDSGALPAELVGKSPAEVAAWYQAREARIRQELTRQPAPPVERPPAPPANSTEFVRDPTKYIDERIKATAMTQEQFSQLAAPYQKAFIRAAKQEVAEKHKDDWSLVVEVVEKIMETTPPEQQTDPNIWETAYVYAKGRIADKLIAEAKLGTPRIGAEGGAPAASSTPVAESVDSIPVVVSGSKTTSAHDVIKGLGITDKMYLDAGKAIADGKWPLTMSNTGR
jgi:hypothetical protein